MKRAKNYFSFFGILISTCFEKLQIFYSKLFEYLKKSNNIFARKFNSGKSEIVDKIYDYIKESNNRRK